MEKKIYLLENLGCANCAAKIERKVAALAGVEEAIITFATKQLRITADNPDQLIPQITKIAVALEPEIVIKPLEKRNNAARSTLKKSAHEEHHHDHGENCSCGHDHAHQAESHEHEEHHHNHGENCTCGHDHKHQAEPYEHEEHHHNHGENCSCGHDHTHQTKAHEHKPISADSKKQVFIIEGLDCANCAAKIERKINELPEVEEAILTFATKQLRVIAKEPLALLPAIQAICTSVEAGAQVTPRGGKNSDTETTKIYSLENLDCANCAAKMERKINELAEVDEATITYTTKQLKITASSPDALLPKIRQICTSIDSKVVVTPKAEKTQIPAAQSSSTKKEISHETKTLWQIAIGALLFVGGLLTSQSLSQWTLPIYLVAYVILGGRIVLTAAKNLTHGQVFDENFLMSIATLGAFAISEYPEAVGVMLFYRIGEYFEERAVEKSRSQIMDAVDMRPEVVNLLLGDEVRVIAAEKADVGDIVLVRPGDRIPLDGSIIEGESRIDTSPVTGEPVPVKVGVGDEVISGCVNTAGLLKIRVEKVLEESMVTRILDSVENAAASKPKIDRFITRFARVYTPFVVALALVTAIVPSLISGNWNYWVYTALTFLVISCPCALVLSVPLAFFSGIGSGSKQGILFKGGLSLEAMKNVKAIVMDKTGTITQGNFTVQEALPTEIGMEKQLLSLAASCELNSTHPIGVSILEAAQKAGITPQAPQAVEEIAGKGVKARCHDAEVLCGNRKLMETFGVILPEIPTGKNGTEVFVARNKQFIGRIIINDTLKEDAVSAIGKIKAQNILTAMLTGDAQESADEVAKATGIDEVHAKLLPEEKLTKLQDIRRRVGAVMFVGDGINDAPVLAGADVGAAMGSGADAAIEAADVVFMTSSMEAIPQAITIARATNRIAVQNVVFALIIKVLVMILGLVGFANMWMAVFADTGVAMLCVLNSVRVLYHK